MLCTTMAIDELSVFTGKGHPRLLLLVVTVFAALAVPAVWGPGGTVESEIEQSAGPCISGGVLQILFRAESESRL